MIRLEGVGKKYRTRHGDKLVLRSVDMVIEPGQRVGVLGRNGAGKSTLIRLIGGAEMPTTGRVERSMRASWPLAFTGGFQGSLTGLDNLRFICRVYDADIDRAIPFVESFSELGIYFREPFKTYSAGMAARLAFAISMAIEFDCYLIDEVLAVGDSRFHEKCHEELFVKRADRSIILVSHLPEQMRSLCNVIYVLHEGEMTRFENFDEAYEHYINRCG